MYISDIMVLCECGCGTEISDKDKQGRLRRFVNGHQRRGIKVSEKTRVLMSENMSGNKNWLGKKHTIETKHKLSEALKGNKNRGGKKASKETLLKLSKAAKNISDETRLKMSNSAKGKKLSEATKKKMSEARKGEKNHHFGKVFSEDHKRKISEAKKGTKLSEETKRKMSKAQQGNKSYLWRGGISFEPYCPKFNNAFKEGIRDKFDRKCFICGKLEIEQMEQQKNEGKRPYKLSVHHVNYQKNCLCDDVVCKFVPLCISCHAKTNGDRSNWEQIIIDKLS